MPGRPRAWGARDRPQWAYMSGPAHVRWARAATRNARVQLTPMSVRAIFDNLPPPPPQRLWAVAFCRRGRREFCNLQTQSASFLGRGPK